MVAARQQTPATIAENEVVVLLHPIDTEDGCLPAGSRGVVHDAEPDGSVYLVEFNQPFFCVVDVPGSSVRRG